MKEGGETKLKLCTTFHVPDDIYFSFELEGMHVQPLKKFLTKVLATKYTCKNAADWTGGAPSCETKIVSDNLKWAALGSRFKDDFPQASMHQRHGQDTSTQMGEEETGSWGKETMPLDHLKWLHKNLGELIAATELMREANEQSEGQQGKNRKAAHLDLKRLGVKLGERQQTMMGAAKMMEEMSVGKLHKKHNVVGPRLELEIKPKVTWDCQLAPGLGGNDACWGDEQFMMAGGSMSAKPGGGRDTSPAGLSGGDPRGMMNGPPLSGGAHMIRDLASKFDAWRQSRSGAPKAHGPSPRKSKRGGDGAMRHRGRGRGRGRRKQKQPPRTRAG